MNQARKKYTLETDENGNTFYKIVDCDPCAPIQLIDCNPCGPMKVQDCDPCGQLVKVNPCPPQTLFNPCAPQFLCNPCPPTTSQLSGGKEFFDFQMTKWTGTLAAGCQSIDSSQAIR